jgi:hypothetical protein
VLSNLIVRDRNLLWSLPSQLFLMNQAEVTQVTNSQHIQDVSYKRLSCILCFLRLYLLLLSCKFFVPGTHYEFFTRASRGLSVRVFKVSIPLL